ncbi:glycoside hydrolase family 79 protein [Trichoderma virens Gv29-8]|uniref:Glycoside hydrolase family 79 protein n=1 Tax=Hypocrea virens (strain Gv29-8 / FGSC 10586) TaxID=413071 RepID=G9N4X7_HYPVG|nr:glycoside hydrolase family 79 protein [Trichoderma virens Gv29-8]EHK17824.1 glycoside hydrolase family 79 protein [Trichoderma virens Gv29-8]
MLRHTLLVALCLSQQAVATSNPPIRIAAPGIVPPGASQIVDHAFASFSFPAHWLPDFAGNNSHPNLFSRDILDLLYMLIPSTSDRTYYNASQEQSIQVETGANGIPSAVYIGPVYFEAFNNFPGSLWSFQANLANNASWGLNNTMEVCKHVMNTLKGDLIDFEIGNEVDLYPCAVRSCEYTVYDYLQEWTTYADAISETVLKGNRYGLDEQRFFQALVFANAQLKTFTTPNAFNGGIDLTDHVKSVSLHHYAAGNQGWVRLQESETFMNHTAVVANLSIYSPANEYLKTNYPNITFLLGETNSDYTNLLMNQVEGVFGSSLWLIDYLMYGMSLNITRFNLIQGTTFGYTGWVPVPTGNMQPYVRPPLYGQIVVADVIGHNPYVQILPIDLGPELWKFSAYGVYESSKLNKYVLINLDEWNSTTRYPRPSQQIKLNFPSGVKVAKVQRLLGAGASADSGISWGGLSWNYTHGRLTQSGRPHNEVLRISKGMAKLTIPSTEAVVVTLDE